MVGQLFLVRLCQRECLDELCFGDNHSCLTVFAWLCPGRYFIDARSFVYLDCREDFVTGCHFHGCVAHCVIGFDLVVVDVKNIAPLDDFSGFLAGELGECQCTLN